MSRQSGSTRVDRASRVISASARRIYEALVDPKALVSWLPPKGMTGRIEAFDAREGGSFRMTLTYQEAEGALPGKSSKNTDVVQGRFRELVPDERVVQVVQFESDDPAFAGAMTMTWSLVATPAGTEVSITCENVPEGIRPDDHDTGLRSSLANLAAFLESPDTPRQP